MAHPKEVDDELPGFEAPTQEANKKEGQNSKKKASGGFQSMGFSFPVLKGIAKRGYKQPTPIQRKVSRLRFFMFSITLFLYSPPEFLIISALFGLLYKMHIAMCIFIILCTTFDKHNFHC